MSVLGDLLNAGFETVSTQKQQAPTPKPQEETPWYQNIIDAVTSPTAQKIATVAAPVLGGLIGNQVAKADYNRAEQTQQHAADLAGTYIPVGTSATSLIQDNPELIALRRSALQKLQQQAETGTTPEDEAYRRQQQSIVNKNFQARQAQIQDEMARRGAQQNSGLALAQSLAGNQQALQQQSEAADADAIRKQQAKQAAFQNLGNMSSTALQQDFSRDLDRASAVDKFNLTNVANQIGAARNKADALAPIAKTQAQAGARTADTINTIGQGIGSVLSTINQKKATPPSQ